MTSILVVCTGNICRSPMAEGLLRAAVRRRLGDRAPEVSSAGTAGWEGSPAMPESIEAASELGVDIEDHRGRKLTIEMARAADLLLCMATEHRKAIASAAPELAGRAFTLKELVRLLEVLPAPAGSVAEAFVPRIVEADAARRAAAVPPSRDDDIADPLGQPPEAYRAIAWELGEWTERLIDGLYGPAADVDADAVAGG
jgi:protein-tyrosine phosphatase